jgi:hypothetical protein
MPVEIQFRGVSLFVVKNAMLEEVRVPNGERVISDGGRENTHADRTVATPHFSRMIILDRADNVVSRHNLFGIKVGVSDGLPAGCGVMPTFSDITRLNELTNVDPSNCPPPTAGAASTAQNLQLRSDRDKDFWERTSTTVKFDSGVIDADKSPPVVFTLNPHQHTRQQPIQTRLPLLAVWRSQSSTAHVALRDAGDRLQADITLDESRPKAIIYNFDREWPSREEILSAEDTTRPGGAIVDDDFKWLYQLLKAPGDDWAAWLAGAKFPAPILVQPQGVPNVAGRRPGSSTCFGATWVKAETA